MLTCRVQGQLQLSLARQGLLGVVSGPANGPQVDVVQLAASAWTPGLVAPSVLEELMLATAHRSHASNRPVYPRRYFRTECSSTYCESLGVDLRVPIDLPIAVKPLALPWTSLPSK